MVWSYAYNSKAMKVIVGPGEGDLENVIEIGERVIRADYQSPPNHRVDAPNPHMDPIRHRTGCITHACQLNSQG